MSPSDNEPTLYSLNEKMNTFITDHKEQHNQLTDSIINLNNSVADIKSYQVELNNTTTELSRVRGKQETLSETVNQLKPQVVENSRLKMILIGAIITLGVSSVFVVNQDIPPTDSVTKAVTQNTQQMAKLLDKLNTK